MLSDLVVITLLISCIGIAPKWLFPLCIGTSQVHFKNFDSCTTDSPPRHLTRYCDFDLSENDPTRN